MAATERKRVEDSAGAGAARPAPGGADAQTALALVPRRQESQTQPAATVVVKSGPRSDLGALGEEEVSARRLGWRGLARTLSIVRVLGALAFYLYLDNYDRTECAIR